MIFLIIGKIQSLPILIGYADGNASMINPSNTATDENISEQEVTNHLASSLSPFIVLIEFVTGKVW